MVNDAERLQDQQRLRIRAVLVVLALVALVSVVWSLRAGPTVPLEVCPDGGRFVKGHDGIVFCGAVNDGPAPTPEEAMALRQKFDCNTATAEQFAHVQGISPSLAQTLVAYRDGGFRDWDAVEAVPGVGPTRLNALQTVCEIGLADAGVW